MNWQRIVKEVLDVLSDPLQREEVRWTVVGSVATALQGCDITPNDLDLLTATPAGVQRIAELMAPYAPALCPISNEDESWYSSAALPVSSGPDPFGFIWHFGRWFVDGFKVEAAHIIPPAGFPSSAEGAGIWEAGTEIWPYVRRVPFGAHQVPVVPLEIQLHTSMSRGLARRVEAITAALRAQGSDGELLHKALNEEQRARFAASAR